MKQVSKAAVISLILLLMISNTRGRLLPSQEQADKYNPKNIQQDDSFSSLMGLEECSDKDERCEKRRMVAEAHLDYIYTQHQHP
ncbi:putative phytosulfokines 6 [Salvia miltiorrhiza]|uniref:putative phytosulfokines 6 n=1 Tax=Salvia miltiorrhiza TaxID=226208 RepID=UPI0025AC7F1C|nr:putative phytosulfokines 6 [Salvia miltiorrhiza]